MPVGGVLFSEMTPDPSWEGEFNAWYDQEHIPLRMNVPGFLGAQRYRRTDRPGYLAVYDMEAPDVLASPAYRQVKDNPSDLTQRMLGSVSGFTRYTGRLISWQGQDASEEAALESPYLYAVAFSVPAEREEEFDSWYKEDHVPLLLENPHWALCRRYRVVGGEPEPYTHLALHHLTSLDALSSPEREKARSTPWRARLAQEDWFKASYVVFERHGGRFHSTLSQAR